MAGIDLGVLPSGDLLPVRCVCTYGSGMSPHDSGPISGQTTIYPVSIVIAFDMGSVVPLFLARFRYEDDKFLTDSSSRSGEVTGPTKTRLG